MNITVKPTTVEDIFFIEEILKKMNIPYEKEKTSELKLTEAQEQSIIRGLEQAKKGIFKSNMEVLNKAEKICGM